MASFFLCFAAWTALALGMDRHRADALGNAGRPARLRGLQCTGGSLLLLALWLAVLAPASIFPTPPASFAIAAWAVALSVAAIAVAAVMAWQPQRSPLLGTAALLAGLLGHALSP